MVVTKNILRSYSENNYYQSNKQNEEGENNVENHVGID